jgi:hypothetical protein
LPLIADLVWYSPQTGTSCDFEPDYFMDFDAPTALHFVEFIVAVGATVTSLEILKIRSALRDAGLLSWRVQRLSHPLFVALTNNIGFDFLLRYPNFLVLVGVRLIGAVLLAVLAITNHSTLIPVFLVTFSTLTMTLRSPQGNDGSDQMASIVLVAATAAELIGTQFSKSAALTFIAGQAILAYGTSGFLKLKPAGWHDGTFVIDILRTSSFGNQGLLKWVEGKTFLAKLLGWGVVYGDCGLALAFLLPPPLCLLVLSFGVLLHVGIARMLGLNTFLWSFVATYPAIFWLSTSLYR